jgi:hypothetical protein
MPRTLIETTATYRRYRVTDAQGAVIGEDLETIPAPEQVNESTIRQQAASALAGNRTFLAIASPTGAQVTAQVKALTRQSNGVIRLVLGQLDSTD